MVVSNDHSTEVNPLEPSKLDFFNEIVHVTPEASIHNAVYKVSKVGIYLRLDRCIGCALTTIGSIDMSPE